MTRPLRESFAFSKSDYKSRFSVGKVGLTQSNRTVDQGLSNIPDFEN